MIRLAALACGLLCGLGMHLSGLFRPALLEDLALPEEGRDWALAAGLFAALVVAAVALGLTARLRRPLPGGGMEPVGEGPGWKMVVGGALFGIGWGLAGHVPPGALVALGLLSPGAAIFLISVLGGMILHDLVANRGRRERYSG